MVAVRGSPLPKLMINSIDFLETAISLTSSRKRVLVELLGWAVAMPERSQQDVTFALEIRPASTSHALLMHFKKNYVLERKKRQEIYNHLPFR